jgi:hypothetical protein
MWGVYHWWGFNVGLVGYEVSKIIINAVTQTLFCILIINFSLILPYKNISGEKAYCFV